MATADEADSQRRCDFVAIFHGMTLMAAAAAHFLPFVRHVNVWQEGFAISRSWRRRRIPEIVVCVHPVQTREELRPAPAPVDAAPVSA
jgi:hypothetical protein